MHSAKVLNIIIKAEKYLLEALHQTIFLKAPEKTTLKTKLQAHI